MQSSGCLLIRRWLAAAAECNGFSSRGVIRRFAFACSYKQMLRTYCDAFAVLGLVGFLQSHAGGHPGAWQHMRDDHMNHMI